MEGHVDKFKGGQKMFNEPGKKLKSLAKVIFWIFVVIGVLAFVGALMGGNSGGMRTGTVEAIGAFLMPFVFILVGWLSSIGLYAAVEAVEDIHALRQRYAPEGRPVMRAQDPTQVPTVVRAQSQTETPEP